MFYQLGTQNCSKKFNPGDFYNAAREGGREGLKSLKLAWRALVLNTLVGWW